MGQRNEFGHVPEYDDGGNDFEVSAKLVLDEGTFATLSEINEAMTDYTNVNASKSARLEALKKICSRHSDDDARKGAPKSKLECPPLQSTFLASRRCCGGVGSRWVMLLINGPRAPGAANCAAGPSAESSGLAAAGWRPPALPVAARETDGSRRPPKAF